MGFRHWILVPPKNRRQNLLHVRLHFLPGDEGHPADHLSGPLTHDWDAEAAAIAISAVADERSKKSDGGVLPAKVQPVETLDD